MDLFSLSDLALDPCSLSKTVCDRAAGGYVSFEGWVRDHHENRAVDHLEYEAYPALCLNAGTGIVQEAIERYRLRRVRAVHRTGTLAIGEIAVWVGVSTDHRQEAFDACEWIIDRIKHELPIWKKEFYPDGTSVWVRCQACANHPVAA